LSLQEERDEGQDKQSKARKKGNDKKKTKKEEKKKGNDKRKRRQKKRREGNTRQRGYTMKQLLCKLGALNKTKQDTTKTKQDREG
jgi:hypothetical protein